MAYDQELADRVRALLSSEDDVSEKAMFGGLAFLVGGSMAVAVSSHGGLMLRCDPASTDALRARAHTGPMIMRGREMTGWLRVEPAGIATEDDLAGWVRPAVRYARALPQT